MELASRPTLEPLSDLPVEEPPHAATPRTEPQAAVPAPPVVQPAPAAATPPRDPEQTGLNFVDPELFLAAGQQPSAIPLTPPIKDPDPPLELELEDPVVDDMLTSPPPPPPAATAAKPPAVALTAAVPATGKSVPKSGVAAIDTRSSRVPIAKTASLSAAATKLAAAMTQRTVSSSKPAVAAVAAVRAAPAKDAPAGETRTKETPAKDATAREAPAPAASASSARAAAQPAPKLDAPSLASWASARSAAMPAAKTAPAPATSAAAAPPPAAAPAGAKSAAPKAAAPAATAPTAASAPMDRDFIARNQVVERYLSGRLPLKGATDFERFCKEHPQLLDEIGLPERVNAGLRLLEASGKPEPWQEAARPVWQKPMVTLGLAGGVALFAITLAIVAGGSVSKSHRIAELQKRVTEQALDPATSTREIRLLPSRSGASNAPAITIGGGKAELADLKIDESRSPYHLFRITIDRIDQGRVGVIANIAKDSNGHLRIALNSSALGPGNYQFTLAGIDWRGDPQPDSWITIGVAR